MQNRAGILLIEGEKGVERRHMQHRTLAVLKPHETTWDAFRTEYDAIVSGKAPPFAYNERLDELIDAHIDDVRGIAKELGIEMDVTEYEIVAAQKGVVSHTGGIFSRNGHRSINTADVVATVSPPPAILSYIMTCVNAHPMLRGLIGFKDQETMENAMAFVHNLQTPLFAQEEGHSVSKLFPVHIDKLTRNSKETIRNALLYPHSKKARSNYMQQQLFVPFNTENRYFEEGDF
jgi:hypothetical protein